MAPDAAAVPGKLLEFIGAKRAPVVEQLIATYLEAVIRKDASAVEKSLPSGRRIRRQRRGTARSDCGTLPLISQECHTALPWLGLHRGREAVKAFPCAHALQPGVTAFGPREVISEGNRKRFLAGSASTPCRLAEQWIFLFGLLRTSHRIPDYPG